MKRVTLVSLFTLLTFPLVAPADSASASSSTSADRVRRYLERGEKVVALAERETRTARRLQVLERALRTLDRARALRGTQSTSGERLPSDAEIDRATLHALNSIARIHLDRGALIPARDVNRRALALRTPSVQALTLHAEIHKRLLKDLFDDKGIAAIQRVRERRAAAGAPVRDRGRARRR